MPKRSATTSSGTRMVLARRLGDPSKCKRDLGNRRRIIYRHRIHPRSFQFHEHGPASQPSTNQPSTSWLPTNQLSASRPPTSRPPTSQPPTSQPPTSQLPTSQLSTS